MLRLTRIVVATFMALSITTFSARVHAADSFDSFIKPAFAKSCNKCHGEKKVKGKVNLEQLTSRKQLLANPSLIEEMVDVIQFNDMPPEDEPQLDAKVRDRLLTELKQILEEAAIAKGHGPSPIQRLNRYQYNNVIRDLFGLKVDPFALPEKLMTRYDGYLRNSSGTMPDQVQVASDTLKPRLGMQDVKAFPKDLRASHGYDNQADQLTLSPLLLDSFLKLSQSILASPDFTPKLVGRWDELFAEPTPDDDASQVIRTRLQKFLRRAFRGPVGPETLERYTAYANQKHAAGLAFPEAMKRVISAALASPMFLFRSTASDGSERQYDLASRLSFFLWNSMPDDELLDLADRNELANIETLNRTLDRMLADPKIERFLDVFPTQWLQLENILTAVPDPKKSRYFNMDANRPASLQMLLEPLLQFDTTFIENRPVIELISPKVVYQSDFLNTWYTSDLQPPKPDVASVEKENKRIADEKLSLQTTIDDNQQALQQLLQPIRDRLLAEQAKTRSSGKAMDLKPYAAWDFDNDLTDRIGSLDLTAKGKVEYEAGMVVLAKRAFLQSGNLPIELTAKTMEVWCKLDSVKQRGGGVMTVQGPSGLFDSIVLGERQPQHWISGSNGFQRTDDFPNSTPEQTTDQVLHLVMVYEADGTTRLYRNGEPYGGSFKKSPGKFPANKTSILFGLRHLPPGGNKHLEVKIDRARLFDRALTEAEVKSSNAGNDFYIPDDTLIAALTEQQNNQRKSMEDAVRKASQALEALPKPTDVGKYRQQVVQKYENDLRNKMRSRVFKRVTLKDPRYGGVLTNAAILSMTSGTKRTKPITRGAWVIEVILNDPPPPPPNDVPPLNEDASAKHLTIREKLAEHRENPDCAGCHARIDPLGFALENFDLVGRWRDRYPNGRDVDATGTLMRKYPFKDIVEFKQSLVREERRIATAFTKHLLRFATGRELSPLDNVVVESIVSRSQSERFRLKNLIRQVILSDSFQVIE